MSKSLATRGRLSVAVADGNQLDSRQPPESGQVLRSGDLPRSHDADSQFALTHHSARPGIALASVCKVIRVRIQPFNCPIAFRSIPVSNLL